MSFLSRASLRTAAFGLLALGVVFLGLQFIRPRLDNPPVMADLRASTSVKEILRNSCYNCHSNETRLPWYDEVVPAYWLVTRDVRKGREHLNFSNFDTLPAAKQKGLLYESVNQIQLGAMPPRDYTLLHPGAVVTSAQLDVLKEYLHPTGTTAAPAAPTEAADAQYAAWIAAAVSPAVDTKPAPVKPAPNGLAFFPDYKDWKPISTTDRFDNNTLRVILGNPVAIQAIAENRITPWPDGAAFAKIAYSKMPDGTGLVRTGEFTQVEFMVKDAKKYASTKGWGWGRWLGTAHIPYGKEETFARECVSCHLPLKKNDFVFTMPIAPLPSALFNREAALPSDLPYQPFQWRVLTSSLDLNEATMTTVYANDPAIAHARTAPGSPYPAGAVLARVTWFQQEDRHWFGGKIPGRIKSIEFVTVGDGIAPVSYQAFEGTPLQKITQSPETASARITAILGERAAVMP